MLVNIDNLFGTELKPVRSKLVNQKIVWADGEVAKSRLLSEVHSSSLGFYEYDSIFGSDINIYLSS